MLVYFSYYNEKEMMMVLKYIQALTSLKFDNKDDQVKPEQIGIVTPYIRQVKIKMMIRFWKLKFKKKFSCLLAFEL